MNILILALALFSFGAHGAELKQGRYLGWISFDANKRLAVVADFFGEAPDSYKEFPRLNASLRISLGGYNSHEYLAETYHDLKYDFDGGELTFSEDGNDFVMNTRITAQSGRTKISGSVFVRSAAIRGTIELLEESDEPGDDFQPAGNIATSTENFQPTLEGQYEGQCNGKEAALQVQTVRQSTKESSSRGLDRHYRIFGRLIAKNDSLCGSQKDRWCSRQHFHQGTFNIYSGQLNFESNQGTERCRQIGEQLSCQIRAFQETLNCQFRKPREILPSRFFPRGFHLESTKEQREALPEPAPPLNTNLREALDATFSGYLHNESNNTYLPLKLDVIPFSTSENPHNPNQLWISATASIFFARDFSGAPLVQRFAARSFYLRPGFMLAGPEAEYSFAVTNWRKGFISGVWLSKNFGKIGTFQLIKGELQPLPQPAKIVPSIVGEFQATVANSTQWIRFSPAMEPLEFSGDSIPFTGSYQTIVGSSPIKPIMGGSFDLLTGRFGWWIQHDEAESVGSGIMREDGNADLFWPPLPVLGTNVPNFIFRNFQRKEFL